MRFWEASTSFFVEDSPGLSWILGGLFFFVGGVFALGSLGLATNAAELSFGVRTVIFVLGTIGVGTGVWVWKRSPLSRVQVNVSDRYILINRWGITGRERTPVNFADVLAVELEPARIVKEILFIGRSYDCATKPLCYFRCYMFMTERRLNA